MKILAGFVAGFLLAAAISVATVQAFFFGVRSGRATCPECDSCEEGIESQGFSTTDPLEARR